MDSSVLCKMFEVVKDMHIKCTAQGIKTHYQAIIPLIRQWDGQRERSDSKILRHMFSVLSTHYRDLLWFWWEIRHCKPQNTSKFGRITLGNFRKTISFRASFFILASRWQKELREGNKRERERERNDFDNFSFASLCLLFSRAYVLLQCVAEVLKKVSKFIFFCLLFLFFVVFFLNSFSFVLHIDH